MNANDRPDIASLLAQSRKLIELSEEVMAYAKSLDRQLVKVRSECATALAQAEAVRRKSYRS